jgi:hypothetical protein
VKRFLGLFCLFLIFSPISVFAATSVLTYDVYAGGIHAVNAKLTLKKEKSRYDIILNAGTQGFLKKIANWSGRYVSKGLIKSGKTYPTLHESSSTWKNKTEIKTFKYDGKGHFKSYKVVEEKVETSPKEIDFSLAKDTTDILSATLQTMLAIPQSKICSGKELVFDGDRNFRLTFSDTKIEKLTKSDYNIYDGQAISCKVEVKPEKGKWRKKPRGWLSIQEQGRKKGELPTIWFGQIEGQPDLYMPIKIRVKTDYGTLFMHLTSVKTW